jgi:hypothetical protein
MELLLVSIPWKQNFIYFLFCYVRNTTRILFCFLKRFLVQFRNFSVSPKLSNFSGNRCQLRPDTYFAKCVTKNGNPSNTTPLTIMKFLRVCVLWEGGGDLKNVFVYLSCPSEASPFKAATCPSWAWVGHMWRRCKHRCQVRYH